MVLGWGSMTDSSGQMSSVLLKASVPVMDQVTCEKKFANKIKDSMVCAGGAETDSCSGDSGGPLFLNNMEGPQQVGIVSWGLRKCATEGYPGVYTRISSYHCFLGYYIPELFPNENTSHSCNQSLRNTDQRVLPQPGGMAYELRLGEHSCFPADANVELKDGRQLRMDEIVEGDLLKVGVDSYSQVFWFGHRDPGQTGNYLRFTMDNGRQLELSPDHLVYIMRGLQRVLRPAKDVAVGDRVVTDGLGDTIQGKDSIVKVGLYQPHTLNGNIFVNGVLCSSYTNKLPPRFSHAILALERLAFSLKRTILSDKFHVTRPSWATFVMLIGSWYNV
mmetsp:Transcript_17631/g.36577  ORF Transcript_17631/g.36577 Transcript_17631/m.36577 type:complete len:332 (-) Transcript_17631:955-1950(-)